MLVNSSPLTLPKYSATELFTQATYTNLNINVASGQTLTVRVYPWWPSTASTTKYLVERNIKITGKTSSSSQGMAAIKDSQTSLELTTESEKPELQKMLIFPNPVKEKLTVAFKETASAGKISVLDVMGSKLLEQSVQPNSSQVSINVSGLASGNYFLILQQGNARQTGQFVKY